MTEHQKILFDKMYTALMAIKLRLVFTGPHEPQWNARTVEKPHMIPDWRKEILLIEEIQAIKENNPNM